MVHSVSAFSEFLMLKISSSFQDVLHSVRCKLFVFGETLLDKGTGNKTWRERGIGNCRILQHKEHQRIRVLMRQEKTMKVVANFALDPRIKLEPNAGSDRSWVWSAFDFSQGELEETVFACRFADSDIANTFKEKFTESQQTMDKILAGEDSGEGGAEADEAAAALENLKTSEEEETPNED